MTIDGSAEGAKLPPAIPKLDLSKVEKQQPGAEEKVDPLKEKLQSLVAQVASKSLERHQEWMLLQEVMKQLKAKPTQEKGRLQKLISPLLSAWTEEKVYGSSTPQSGDGAGQSTQLLTTFDTAGASAILGAGNVVVSLGVLLGAVRSGVMSQEIYRDAKQLEEYIALSTPEDLKEILDDPLLQEKLEADVAVLNQRADQLDKEIAIERNLDRKEQLILQKEFIKNLAHAKTVLAKELLGEASKLGILGVASLGLSGLSLGVRAAFLLNAAQVVSVSVTAANLAGAAGTALVVPLLLFSLVSHHKELKATKQNLKQVVAFEQQLQQLLPIVKEGERVFSPSSHVPHPLQRTFSQNFQEYLQSISLSQGVDSTLSVTSAITRPSESELSESEEVSEEGDVVIPPEEQMEDLARQRVERITDVQKLLEYSHRKLADRSLDAKLHLFKDGALLGAAAAGVVAAATAGWGSPAAIGAGVAAGAATAIYFGGKGWHSYSMRSRKKKAITDRRRELQSAQLEEVDLYQQLAKEVGKELSASKKDLKKLRELHKVEVKQGVSRYWPHIKQMEERMYWQQSFVSEAKARGSLYMDTNAFMAFARNTLIKERVQGVACRPVREGDELSDTTFTNVFLTIMMTSSLGKKLEPHAFRDAFLYDDKFAREAWKSIFK